jgi:hypothetical protein
MWHGFTARKGGGDLPRMRERLSAEGLDVLHFGPEYCEASPYHEQGGE